MIEELSKLDPSFNGSELIITCPKCGDRFGIRINYQGDPIGPSTWGLKHPESEFNWDNVTLEPSINNHPQARGKSKCDAHFTVYEGKIIYS